MPTLNELLAEDDAPPFTERDYHRERAELQEQFLMTYGVVSADDINRRIRSGEIDDGNDLVERWLSLQDAERHLDLEPPKRNHAGAEHPTGRDSGLFYFRSLLSLRAARLYCAWWMRSMRSSWRRRRPSSHRTTRTS